MTSDLKALIGATAKAAGFDVMRVMRVDAFGIEPGERLAAFLRQGRHGEMDWLATRAEQRAHPTALWKEARSAIVLAKNYGPSSDPLQLLADKGRGVVSAYAQGRDYHDVVKSGLKQVARALADAASADVKVFVDTAPLMEKPLAQAAGLGWQGKHTNLVSQEFGSWLFLGVILTTADLPPDAPEVDHCGTCRKCLDACPTGAFIAPYQLDARRCIAYLTIEHKGHIDEAFRAGIGNRVFGCDDCLAVCPWNKFAQAARDQRLTSKADLASIALAELLALDDATFRAKFAGTPVKRTGRDRVVRNALIAAGNSIDPGLLPGVTALLADASPLVRAMAVWAARQLCDASAFAALAEKFADGETDPHVKREWARGDDA
ncbi:MAG: tRNA epoxyqueuosine(34) reductase QueG [Hyphomicrobiales bacterium]|nr:MAG: tRNA epoxyqueuosine(34) reductase QueG [Hyphomicrobiales bacterium]